MAMTLKKWISLAENEVKGAERAADFISTALKDNLKYGKKYTAALVHFFGEKSTQVAGREIREAEKQLKKAKERLQKQAKERRAQLAWAKKKLKG